MVEVINLFPIKIKKFYIITNKETIVVLFIYRFTEYFQISYI